MIIAQDDMLCYNNPKRKIVKRFYKRCAPIFSQKAKRLVNIETFRRASPLRRGAPKIAPAAQFLRYIIIIASRKAAARFVKYELRLMGLCVNNL